MNTSIGKYHVQEISDEYLIIDLPDEREIHIIGGVDDPKLVAEIYAKADSRSADVRCYHLREAK